jgi:hypothetical protein
MIFVLSRLSSLKNLAGTYYVLITFPERQLVCLRTLNMQVWVERYLFKSKGIFLDSMKCLRIWT